MKIAAKLSGLILFLLCSTSTWAINYYTAADVCFNGALVVNSDFEESLFDIEPTSNYTLPVTSPISLVVFEAEITSGNQVGIFWVSSAERGNDYFTVLKSIDGVNWEEFQIVPGAGTTVELNDYMVYDSPTESAILYYQLKQSNFDGTSNYFDIVTVDFFSTNEELVLYPIPTEGWTKLNTSKSVAINEIELFNIMGEQLSDVIDIEKQTKGQFLLDLETLNAGVYTVRVGQKLRRVSKN